MFFAVSGDSSMGQMDNVDESKRSACGGGRGQRWDQKCGDQKRGGQMGNVAETKSGTEIIACLQTAVGQQLRGSDGRCWRIQEICMLGEGARVNGGTRSVGVRWAMQLKHN